MRYTVPAEPSRSRVYVWRHLRALCAQTVSPGFAVLPDTPENLAALTALEADVRRLGGEAFLLRFSYVNDADERAVRARFETAAREEEEALLRRCRELSVRIESDDPNKRGALRELRDALDRFQKSPLRSFSKKSGGTLSGAFGEISGALRALPAEVGALLRGK